MVQIIMGTTMLFVGLGYSIAGMKTDKDSTQILGAIWYVGGIVVLLLSI